MTRRALLVAFLAGAGVLALEVLASRWLAPGFGFTLTTWSFLISATLLAGSLGAWLGGRLASKAAAFRTTIALLVAAVWCGALAFFAPLLVRALREATPLVGAATASSAILLIPVLALSAVLPLAVAAAGEVVPRRLGAILAASTAGSLVGTLGAALLGVPILGLRASALLVGALLAAGASLVAPGQWTRLAARLLALALLGLSLVGRNQFTDDGRIVRETAWGRIELVREGPRATLRVDGILQGTVDRLVPLRGSLLRARQWVELLPYLRPGRRAVQVGLGTGLVPRVLAEYGIRTDTIEVNPVLADLVRSELGYAGPVSIGDGRAVLARRADRWDFLILDAFQGESLPAHLLTREAFVEYAARLAEPGLLSLHLIARPGHAVTASVARTLRSVFPHLLCLRSGVGEELQDLWFFASREPLHPPLEALHGVFLPNPSSGVVLTDDRSPLDLMNEPLARALRRASQTPR